MLFLAIVLLSSSFIPTVLAAPALTNPSPATSSYVFGKDADLFSVRITDSLLNTSRAKLHIRVDDPTSLWADVSLSCSGGPDWNCNTTVTGLNALVKDGDTLLYYFDAYNTNNEYGSSGSTSDPVKSTVDRSFPQVFFKLPANNSYVGGNATITITASDKLSGVNTSSVNYSFDNVTYKSMALSGGDYNNAESWNTGVYSNNQSVNIYATASDKVENRNYALIRVFIDNLPPTIISVSPSSSQLLSGAYAFSLNAQDTHAGVNDSSASFQIGSTSVAMACSNGSCNKNYDTVAIADGEYSIDFFVSDKAGNKAKSTANITVDNLPPTITILSPSDGQNVQGETAIKATVADAVIGVKAVEYRWEKSSSSGDWKNMSCPTSTCSSTLDTTGFQSGEYNITVRASDNLNHQATKTVKIVLSSSPSSSSSPSYSSPSPSSGGSGNQSSTTTPGSNRTSSTPGVPPAAPDQPSQPAVCGNNVCEASETCLSCEVDCGKCDILDLPRVLLDLPRMLLDLPKPILDSPFLKTDEGKIIFVTGILSAIIAAYVILQHAIRRKK